MIYFTGDVNLTDNAFDVGFGVGSLIAEGMNPFQYIEKNDADLWVGNFEGVSADVSVKHGAQEKMFKLPSRYLGNTVGLIDYYGIANNHVMEHGWEAYHQMASNLAGVCKGVFGSNDKKSVIFEHDGKHISVTGFSVRNDQHGVAPAYWNFPENDDVIKELSILDGIDYKVAYIHWGVEFVDHPYNEQRRYSHWLIDAGFDLIIGMHPHVMQGYEIYKNKYIFYSLGNFVFEMPWEPTNYGLVVQLDVQKGNVNFEYVKIDEKFCPHIVVECEVPENYRMESLRGKVVNNDNIEVYVGEANRGLKAYRKANYKYIIRNILRYDFSVLGSMVLDYLKRRF